MHKSATKCNETVGKWCKKQAWSIKNYRYVGDVSDTKKAAQANKGKSPRVDYKKMSSVSYSALRQLDWYSSQPRSHHIEDRRFWCME
jgi:hypothetical protein